MAHPDAVTQILNNHDTLLQAVIYCIKEEKMAVAKQVTFDRLKSSVCFSFFCFRIN